MLDFLVLGQEDLGRELPGLGWGFFLTPIFNWARVFSMICRAYCSVICWYLW
jgi:hypothetical protein